MKIILVVLMLRIALGVPNASESQPLCRPGYKGPPDEQIKLTKDCTNKTLSFACSKLCVYERLGYVGKDGMPVVTRIHEISLATYNNTESARAKTADFISCHKEHYPRLGTNMTSDNCTAFKSFSECMKIKLVKSCELRVVSNSTKMSNDSGVDKVTLVFDPKSKPMEFTLMKKIMECSPGYKGPATELVAKRELCKERFYKTPNVSVSSACFNLCVWKELGYFCVVGLVVEKKVYQINKQMWDYPESVVAKTEDFTICQRRHPTHVEELDVMDNKCAKFKAYHDCIMTRMRKVCERGVESLW